MKKGYIYRMISPSLKTYIGQTIRSIEQRHSAYKHPEKMRGQKKLKAALLKYGYDAFTVEVFEVPSSDLSLIETLIIAQEDSFENGYNGTLGGEGAVSKYTSSEERKNAHRMNELMVREGEALMFSHVPNKFAMGRMVRGMFASDYFVMYNPRS